MIAHMSLVRTKIYLFCMGCGFFWNASSGRPFKHLKSFSFFIISSFESSDLKKTWPDWTNGTQMFLLPSFFSLRVMLLFIPLKKVKAYSLFLVRYNLLYRSRHKRHQHFLVLKISIFLSSLESVHFFHISFTWLRRVF